MQEQEKLIAELEPLLEGAGLVLVELALSRHKNSMSVRAVIYSPLGTGTNECSAAYRLMFPRLQVLLGVQEPFMEIMSPGIDRTFKSRREWDIFKGKSVSVLRKEGGEWIQGKIVSTEGGRVTLAGAGGELVLDLADVVKARLDSTREGN